MDKAGIMRGVNAGIEALLFCGDDEFVDYVIQHMVDGTTFDAEEIAAEDHRMTHGMGKKYHVEISKGVDYDDDL